MAVSSSVQAGLAAWGGDKEMVSQGPLPLFPSSQGPKLRQGGNGVTPVPSAVSAYWKDFNLGKDPV